MQRHIDANPAHRRLHQRTPKYLVDEDYTDFRHLPNAFPNDRELDSLIPLGFWQGPPHGIMVIAYDPRRGKRYAFSQVPQVVFEPVPVDAERSRPYEENGDCTKPWWIILGIIVAVLLLFWYGGATENSDVFPVETLAPFTEDFSEFPTESPFTKETVKYPRIDARERNLDLDDSKAADLKGKKKNVTQSTPVPQTEESYPKAPDQNSSYMAPIQEESFSFDAERQPSEQEAEPSAKVKEIVSLLAFIGTIWWLFSFTGSIKDTPKNGKKKKGQRQSTRTSSMPAGSSMDNNNTIRRRKKGSRRANRQNQILATSADAQAIIPSSSIGVTNMNDEATGQDHEDQDYSGKTLLIQGAELLHVNLSANANEKTDVCPMCLENFHKELSATLCAILPCQHAFCLHCLVDLDEDIDTGRADPTNNIARKRKRECPSCRAPMARLMESAVTEVFTMPTIKNRLDILQGISMEDKMGLVRTLLREHKFVIFKVENCLEDMLMGSLAAPVAALNQHEVADLSPDEKEQIYIETQRPVKQLRRALKNARYELRKLKRKKTKKKDLAKAQHNVQELEGKLLHAIENCREDTYNRINSSGTMGKEQSTGNVWVDFHSLHVPGAKKKFDELVVPILPVMGQVYVITGRGKNSATGTSVLRSALIDHIENYPNPAKQSHMKWEPLNRNEGVIRVSWDE